MPGGESYETIHIGKFMIGDLLSEIINFIIVAAAVFFVIVKLIGAVMKKAAGSTPAPSEPTTKECPMCLSNIPLKARKCAHCTADLG
jgi:large conductance mechanosensitive channel